MEGLEERSYVQWELVDTPTSFIWVIISSNIPFECGDGGIFMMWLQRLHQSTWYHKILWGDRALEEEQLSIRPLLRESKHMNMESGSKLKSTFLA
jgi:hypothetical protein